MQRLTRRLGMGAALLAGAMAGLAGTPAEAHHFRHFGFGFGFPVVYAPPPVFPVYAPPPVYPVYPPPPVYSAYRYGYRYRVHHYRHVTYRHVVHHRSCSCSCCR
jgi:hypothetical protein